MSIEPATEPTDALRKMWDEATQALSRKRGGPQLLAALGGGGAQDEALVRLIDARALWTTTEAGVIVGFAIWRRSAIEALYVEPDRRRHGVARAMVVALRNLDQPPVDALALPGDRAMKSLYESFGWKARLITMHAE